MDGRPRTRGLPCAPNSLTRVDLASSVDVVVGNAGHDLFGVIEETSEAAARWQIEVKLSGVLWLLPAAYATDFGGMSAEQTDPLPAYAAARARTGAMCAAVLPGDPEHTSGGRSWNSPTWTGRRSGCCAVAIRPLVLEQYRHRIDSWQQHAALADAAQ